MIKKSLLFATSAALVLAACNTAPSNNQIQTPVLNTGATNAVQNGSSTSADEPGGYKSLIITNKDVQVNDFSTKGILTAATKRAVIVRVGTVDYTLSYNFMNKFRTLLANANYNTPLGASAKAVGATYKAVTTAGFFARLKAASTATVKSATTPVAEPLWCPAIPPTTPLAAPDACTVSNPDAYTLSASETAFATLLEAQNFVVMPDFLQEGDAAAESTTNGSLDALTGNDPNSISFVNTKTIRSDFYKKLNSYLNDDRNQGAYNPFTTTPDTADHVFYAANTNPATTFASSNIRTSNYDETGTSTSGIDPLGSLFRMNVMAASDGNGAADSGVAPFDSKRFTAFTTATNYPSTAEKALLTSLVNQAPYISGVALLDASGEIVTGSIGIGFGLGDTVGAASATLADRYDLSGFGVANVNKAYTAATNNMKPADTTNLNAAAAVMMASLMVDSNLTTGNMGDMLTSLATDNGADDSFAQDSALIGPLQQNIRALHMAAGANVNPTAVAPAASLVFPAAVAGAATAPTTLAATTSFITPLAQATPVIAKLDATLCASTCAPISGLATTSGVEFRNDSAYTGVDNIFDALQIAFPTGTYKLGKDLSASLKNLAAIKRFFHADDPTDTGYVYTDDSTEDGRVATRALIVPVTRTVNATTGAVSYTPSPTGTNFIVVTAVAASGSNDLALYVSDPNAKPLEAPATRNITSGDPVLTAAIYNYTGTLVGVEGAGF